MKKCPACGRAYSDMVKTCPTCGVDIAPAAQQQVVKAVVNNEQNTRDNSQSPNQQAFNAVKKTVNKRANPVYWAVYIGVAILVGWLAESGLLGIVVGAVGFGALLGLIPFLAARSRGNKKLGTIAMVVTIVGSFIAGIKLSIPSAIIFTILALKK